MNRILSTLFFLILAFAAFAQPGYVKPLQPNPIRLEHDIPRDGDSCHLAKAVARKHINAGNTKYLLPLPLGIPHKREIIYAVILSRQFGIIPCGFTGSCLRMPGMDDRTDDCYNEVVDSFYSAKYKTNFRNMVIEKVDSMIDNTKPAELKKQYGYWLGKE